MAGSQDSYVLSLPSTLRAHHIEPVSPILDFIVTFVLGWLMWLLVVAFPDPTESYWEQQERIDCSEQEGGDLAPS